LKYKLIHWIALIALLGVSMVEPHVPPARADAADAWWNEAWPYRIPVTASGAGVAEVAINFTEAFAALGLNHALLDIHSIRVVQYMGNTPGDVVPYAETYSTLLEDAENPQIGWSSSGVYWTVNDGNAEADKTRFSQGAGSLKATVINEAGGYGYPGVEFHIAGSDPRRDWSAYEVFVYDVWPEVNASALDQAPDLYWYKLYNACDGGSITQGGPPLALDQWNAASVSLHPLDKCWPADGLNLSNITRMEFHTRDNIDGDVHGPNGFWDDGDVMTLWFDHLRLVDQDAGALRWRVGGGASQYYVYFDVLTHEGHPLPELATDLGTPTRTGMAGQPEAGGYYHRIADANTGDLAVWAAPTVEKILKTMAVPVATAPLQVSAAKGEFEPFQLVVQSPTAQNLVVTASTFTKGADVIPAPTLHRVDYVTITTAGDHFDRFGLWPDPLFPLDNGAAVSFPAGENQPLWFTVNVPWKAAPGVYQGTVAIGSAVIPVELEVWDFALPRETHLDSEWGFGWSSIVEDVYQGYGDWDCYWEMVEAFKQDFINHRLTPKGVGWPAGISYSWFDCADEVLEIGTPTDPWYFTFQGLKYILGQDFNDGYGFSSFVVFGPWQNDAPNSRPSSYCSLSRGTDPPAGSAYNAKWQAYLHALNDYIADPTHPFSQTGYAHIVNEPQTYSDYDVVAYLARMYKQHAPDLRLLLSEQVEPYIYDNPTYGEAKIDIWMPTISCYEPEKSHDRQKNHGEDVWWYYLYGDDPPLPNPILMSHPGVEARLTPWLAWAERVGGLVHYDATDWSPNPWTTPNVTGMDNGDGFFFYPPNQDGSALSACGANGHRLVPSLRWENLRDGMEDYEYLWLLAGGDPEVDVANISDDYVAQVVDSRTRFSHVPTDLVETRAAIAHALTRVAEPPVSLTLDAPNWGYAHTTYTFNATANVTATLPLTFTWMADEQTPVTHRINAASDSVAFQWDTPGNKTITVSVANPAGALSRSHTLSILNGICEVSSPGLAVNLIYTDGLGNPTHVFIPANTFSETATVCYYPLSAITETLPNERSVALAFGGHAFGLTSRPAFTAPFTITVEYADADIARLREAGLRLYTRPADGAWANAIDAANSCYQLEHGTIALGTPEQLERYYTREPAANRIALHLCHLSDFALVGPEGLRVYLPLVMRQ